MTREGPTLISYLTCSGCTHVLHTFKESVMYDDHTGEEYFTDHYDEVWICKLENKIFNYGYACTYPKDFKCPLYKGDGIPDWLRKKIDALRSITVPNPIYGEGYLDAIERILLMRNDD